MLPTRFYTYSVILCHNQKSLAKNTLMCLLGIAIRPEHMAGI